MRELLKNYLDILDKALKENSFRKSEPANLYEPCAYLLEMKGKRLRPIFVLMGAELFKDVTEQAIKPALAVEFFHNFTLMHDDIMDEAPLRRGETTVHKKYNINTAILSGDALMIQAYRMFEDLPDSKFVKVTKLFSKMAEELCEGQQFDMDFETRKAVSFEDYIQMITMKTGVLLGAALKIGAIIADATEENQNKVYEFGKNLGIAFQLKDDFLDVYGNPQIGKVHAGDILENKKTILYINASNDADEKLKRELETWYSGNSKSEEKIKAVKNIFKETEADLKTEKLIEKYTDLAMNELNSITESDSRKYNLRKLTQFLINREI